MRKIFLFLIVATLTVACSRDNDNPSEAPVDTSVGVRGKYEVKLVGSSEVSISAITIIADGVESNFVPMTNSWNREYTASKIEVNVAATGANNNATLKLLLYKDGRLVREIDASRGSIGSVINLGINTTH